METSKGLPTSSELNAHAVRFAIVLLPNFTLTAFSGFVDMLRLASDAGDKSRPARCVWEVIGENLNPVRASCGVTMPPWRTFSTADDFDYLVVIGGLLHSGSEASPATLGFLKQAAEAGKTLVGLCTAPFAFARAGVVGGHKVCVSWFHYQEFVERFPDVPTALVVADALFVEDGNLLTCSGGPGSIDVAATILQRHMDESVITKALRILLVSEQRGWNSPQSHPRSILPDAGPIVRKAVLLMQHYLSSPLGMEEIARRVNTSPRKLERLFGAEIGMSPAAYYKVVRLRYAAWLLRHSTKPLSDIGEACGFVDASHFAREFKRSVGLTPLEARTASGPDVPEGLSMLLEDQVLNLRMRS